MNNNKDIENILDSMFRNPSTGKSRAAEEAEAFLKSINKGIEKAERSNKSKAERLGIAEAERARKNIEELKKQMQSDGLTPKKEEKPKVKAEEKKISDSPSNEADFKTGFKKVTEKMNKEVIGQDDFVKKLILSFKRPFVMGVEENKAASSIIISGKNGTGRHSALKLLVKFLYEEKVFESGEVYEIDLSNYQSGSDNKLLVQDIFAALHSKSKVIVFENYDKCHKSLLPYLSDLVLEGSMRLQSRYVEQKGILVDAGTALVPGAISSINMNGQYLVFITNHHQGKIVDNMGAAFINGISDFCVTDEFTGESLSLIGKRVLRDLNARCKKMLEFTLEYDESIEEFFKTKFSVQEGVNTIEAFADLCFKNLSEYKLMEDAGKLNCKLLAEGEILIIDMGETRLTVSDEPKVDMAEALKDVKAELNDIVGLNEVKEYIYSLEEYYKVMLLRREKGMKADNTSMHMIFTGNPGTGKTTVARIVARYLKAIGVLTGGQLIEVTRADLVGRYVGHTAPLTQQVIESALGGVLFIDEAYALCRGEDDSFGLEAIDTLVKEMESNRKNLVVILAGYKDEMRNFLTMNSGLASRFPNNIDFPDYTAEELLKIAEITVRNKGYKLNELCREPLFKYFERKQADRTKMSGNGRMVRNLVEEALLNQSRRVLKDQSAAFDELTLEDFEL